nr:hypothetical protein [Tanacetum cinerariifolium]
MYVNGAPECMRISRFMHDITNPDLIKRLNDDIHKFVDEMMSVAMAFLWREVAVANKSRKKDPPAWRHHEASHKPNFDKKQDFKNRHKSGRSQDRFTPLIKTPKEILEIETMKFKAPPPMNGPTESQNKNKFCEFHRHKGHSTDECIYLPKQIEKAVKSGQQSHLIKVLKQGGNKGEQTKAAKKGEIRNKEKVTTIFMKCYMNTASTNSIRKYPATTSLLGFGGGISRPLGHISLMVSLGDGEHSTKALMNFMIVKSPSPYNGIIGQPGLRKIQAFPSTAHGMLKFLVERGIVTLRSSTIIPVECKMVAKVSNELPPNELVAAEWIKKQLGCICLETGGHDWHPKIHSETPPKHSRGCPLISQKRMGQAPERKKAIQEEVAKLVDAQIMREVHYYSWISNPVMGKKHDESLCEYTFKCFLDTYKGNHQIQMAEEDEEKTVFHISKGVFCYAKMPFGLKNVRATYQRLMDKAFEKQIGRNLEVYVDDLVIKSHTEQEILMDIEETFQVLRKINMKLNPKQCTFEEEEGMFLGHMPDLGKFYYEAPRGSGPVHRHVGRRENSKIIEPFYRHILMPRGVHSRTYPYKPEGVEFTYALRFEFDASNNEAECEALIASLRIVKHMGVQNMVAKVDSHLVANQINGSYVAKEESMINPGGSAEGEINRRKRDLRGHRRRGMLLDDIIARIPHERYSPSRDKESMNNENQGKAVRRDQRLPIQEFISRALVAKEEKKQQYVKLKIAKMEKYYNAKVRITTLRLGDFVYRKNEASHAKESGKLGPKWEGPYEVVEALGKGPYKLRNGSGDILSRT